jgi:predicted transcriptional regulator
MPKSKSRQRHTTADRKAQVLAFILRHVDDRHYAPTMREIASGIGISLGRVQQVYEELVADGVIDRAEGRARAYVVDRKAAARYVDPS